MTMKQAALQLFQQVMAGQGTGQNVIFSPYGVQQALAVVANGTADATVQKSLMSLVVPTHEQLHNTQTGAMLLLYPEDNRPIRPEKWRDDVKIVATDEAAQQAKTEFQKRILDEVLDSKTPDKGLNLYTALRYFAKWDLPFPEENTEKRPFTLANGQKIQVDTMKSTLSGAHGIQKSKYDAAVLTAAEQSARVYFIKPKGSNIAWVQEHLEDIIEPASRPGHMQGVMDFLSSSETETILEMPKLSLESHLGITEFLRGIYPFSKDAFYLEKITSEYLFKLQNAEQIAKLTVNEVSAEAKVFTTMTMCCVAGIRPEPKLIHIKIDSPYFLVIQDTTAKGDGRIVLTAWIADPRG